MVLVVEPLFDELRVRMVAGENDRLGRPVAALDFVPVLHQVLQHFVDGILVEQPTVDGGRIDAIRQVSGFHIVPPVQGFPPLLFLVAEGVVVDALAGEPESHPKHTQHLSLIHI